MTDARGPALATAIVSDCKLATWSMPCEFERVYVAREDLVDLDATLVQVVYAAQRTNPDSRSAWKHEYDIDFAVRKKVAVDDLPTLDNLSILLDEIVDYWKTHKPTGTSCVLSAAEWPLPFVPDHLTTLKQFTGVIRLTFRLVRTNS